MATCLHDVEEHFLAQAVLFLEELVFGVSARDVPANQLLTGRRHLQEFRVLILDGHILRVAQQLPHDRPKVVRDPSPDEILGKRAKGRCFVYYLGGIKKEHLAVVHLHL